jgi:20S proteasome alpha/beta subunit
MTVIVGILCSDGVVIGTDSALAVGRVGRYTIERQEGNVLKIEITEGDIITAFTGAAGLSQRFNDQVAEIIKALRRPYTQPRLVSGIGPVGSPLQLALYNMNFPNGRIAYDEIKPVDIGRIVSQLTIDDFRKTPSVLQQQPTIGWGFGALFAFVSGNEPQLIDFDSVSFHPELKGIPDPNRAGQDRIWRCVSMGAGQALADAFLAHSYRLLFGEKIPTIDRAKLVVAWTIQHVIRYNPGLVGGELQLAILEKRDGIWVAHHEDPGETEGQVDDLEKYISEFVEKRNPDAAANASPVDIHEELKPENPTDILGVTKGS